MLNEESQFNFDVVIAGAGPVGLSLALNLGLSNFKVLVLEKEEHLHRHSRAPAIWPKTQEILAHLGVINRFQKEGLVHKRPQLVDADSEIEKVLLDLDFSQISDKTSFPQLIVLPQEKTERILFEEIQKSCPGVKVQFGSKLESFQENGNQVVVQYKFGEKIKQVSASFLVGCDGAHSHVREALGFHLVGQTYSVRAGLADVSLKEVRSYNSPRVSTQNGLAVAIEIEPNLWRIILPYPEKDDFNLDKTLSQVIPSLFSQSEYEVIWKSDFRLHHRLSEKFQKSRVVLAGDAAHLNSPVGGQGMNSGIQDGALLASALVQDLQTGQVKAVESYARQRREEIEEGVNHFTDALTKILFLFQGRLLKRIISLFGRLTVFRSIRRSFLMKVAMLRH